MPSVERWYVLSSVVRRYISFIVSGTSMNYISLYHQWYGGIYLFHASSGTLVCVIVSGTAVHLFHRQWYVDELSPFISSVVRWYISLIPSVERGYVLSSVVRRYISFIVNGTSMNHLFYIISGTVVYISSCLHWNVGRCYRQW